MHDWLQQRALFEELALPHSNSLLRAALRLTGSRSAAEDLVQDTLLSAWRAFKRFQPGTDCKAWLFRIMLNGSNRARTELRRSQSLVPIEDSEPVAPRNSDPLENESIERALASLPQEQRIALLLAAVEGFSCQEIADITGAPIGTVMSRLSRGRSALKSQWLPASLTNGPRKKAHGL
ncbi:MAG: sigma-70 family RNA polymerase sigma factor [Acidobacteriales bacterium]|nr:sigma-70 family RNA polymerase sigma factor [Terriglobales bacterium]